MSKELKPLLPLVATAAVVAAVAACTTPAETGGPEEGKYLARNWCSTCHTVDVEGTGAKVAPSFITIANDPLRTDTYLRGWLSDPHPPMPQLNLTKTEIDDIVAYLETLRQQ
jgi:mono/diheme cytochrome c family protein